MAGKAHRHLIILSSSYSTCSRIGLDFVDDDEGFGIALERLRGAYCGKSVPFSVHFIPTYSASWDSVVCKDPYFDDVRIIASVDEFVGLVCRERYLKGADVARYILSKSHRTYAELQMLVYLCYAEYLCETGSHLFTDRIFASRYGPVVETVYRRYVGGRQSECIGFDPLDDKVLRWTKSDPMAIRSRLMFSEDGIGKTYSIDRTLEKYCDLTVTELVAITCKANSPWGHTIHVGGSDVISDEIIRKYHHNEI